VSDDWLRQGHEIDSAELTTVLSSSSLLADRTGAPPPRRFTWRAVVTGGAVALLATLGVVGVANALGDNLFPSLGPTSPASVWQNPVPATEPEPDDVATTTAPTTTAPPTTSPVPTTGPATPSPTTAVAPGAVAPAPTTSDPRRDGGDDGDGDDDIAVTTVPAPSDDRGSDADGSSSGSGSSGNSGSGSSGSGDSSDAD
jgi:uncharacterized membrane protein YgcG